MLPKQKDKVWLFGRAETEARWGEALRLAQAERDAQDSVEKSL